MPIPEGESEMQFSKVERNTVTQAYFAARLSQQRRGKVHVSPYSPGEFRRPGGAEFGDNGDTSIFHHGLPPTSKGERCMCHRILPANSAARAARNSGITVTHV